MNTVEDRLVRHFEQRAESVAVSPGAWSDNQRRLDQRSARSTWWRPALIAATVAALILGATTALVLGNRPADPAAVEEPTVLSLIGGGTATSCPRQNSSSMKVSGLEILDAMDNAQFILFPDGGPIACLESPRATHAMVMTSSPAAPITAAILRKEHGAPYLWGTVLRTAWSLRITIDDEKPQTYALVVTDDTPEPHLGGGWGQAAPFAGGLPNSTTTVTLEALDQRGSTLQRVEFDVVAESVTDGS